MNRMARRIFLGEVVLRGGYVWYTELVLLGKEISMLNCMIVGLGGFLGSVCRYLIGLIPVREGTVFPVKTFAINVAGAFLIGVTAGLAAKNSSVNPRFVLFLKVGICGGFTTFSSFALESSDLMKGGHPLMAVLYAGMSIAAGVLAVFAGEAATG